MAESSTCSLTPLRFVVDLEGVKGLLKGLGSEASGANPATFVDASLTQDLERDGAFSAEKPLKRIKAAQTRDRRPWNAVLVFYRMPRNLPDTPALNFSKACHGAAPRSAAARER